MNRRVPAVLLAKTSETMSPNPNSLSFNFFGADFRLVMAAGPACERWDPDFIKYPVPTKP